MDRIKAFHQKIINEKGDIEIDIYFNLYREEFYNQVKLPSNFSLDITGKSGFFIHHDKLYEYEVITGKKYDKSHIEAVISARELIKDVDYKIEIKQYRTKQNKLQSKNHYYFTPHAFKLCLMLAKNSKIYARYFLILEEVFKFYGEYRDELRDMKNKEKDKIIISKETEKQRLIRILEDNNIKLDNMCSNSEKVLSNLEHIHPVHHDIESKLSQYSNDKQ